MQALGQLIPVGGGDAIPLEKSRLLIGRRESCDITLRFPNVSSHHCELELVNGYWRVRDLNSRNGIKVNNERRDLSWLSPGDQISIARHVYEIQYEPSSEAPPPEVMNIMSMSLLEKAGLTRRDEAYHQRTLPEIKVKELLPEDGIPDWFLEETRPNDSRPK